MRITFAKYAFKEILEQLQYSGITDITITKEDGNLIIVVPETSIKQAVSYVYNTDTAVNTDGHVTAKKTNGSGIVAIC